MLEKENKAECKKRLKKAHWMWFDTSQPTRTYKQMKDVPDDVFIRWNHVVFIEFKGSTGSPTEGQIKWAAKVNEHLGDNVHHHFIYHPDELPPWMLKVPPGPAGSGLDSINTM